MRFRHWFEVLDGGAATSLLHGGLQDPNTRLNTNLPCQSKYVAKDNQADSNQADNDPPVKTKPEIVFGFRKKGEKPRPQTPADQQRMIGNVGIYT